MRHWIRAHGWLIGVLAVATFAMLFRLGDRPIENWDEGIHGAVSLEMVEDGDWLTPHYMGGSYFRKPPLKIWMSSALFEWFGANAWTLRLPSALAGIATSLLVAWWMWQWRRNRLDAFLAGAIVATMRPIFFHGFRTGEMDGMLTLFTTAALYCWWKAVQCAADQAHEIRNPKSEIRNKSQNSNFENLNLFRVSRFGFRVSRRGWWFALYGVAIGLAIMTKSAAGLLPLPIIAADYLLHRRWRTIPIRFLLLVSCLLLLVAAPWHIIMTVLHGVAFWQDYVGWHVVKRATQALHNEAAGTWWYIQTFLRRFSPYSYVFAAAFILAVVRARRQWGEMPALGSVDDRAGTVPPEVESEGGKAASERAGRANDLESGRPTSAAEHTHTETYLLLWFLLGFLLFSLMKTKFDWYLLPLYPAAAMLTAWFLAEIRAVIHGRMLHVAYSIAFILLFGVGGAVTAHHLVMRYPLNPLSPIASTIRGSNGILVSYGMDYKQHPAGYFILRNTLRNDVRILDGQSDVARTISMLRERERGFLLTQNGTELPKELRAVTRDPKIFDSFTLWQRR